MYTQLLQINQKPQPFQYYTAEELWNDKHSSEQMLQYHLHPDLDLASRNRDFIERSIVWIANRFALEAGKLVCDFGCGPGLYCAGLARLGAQVTGIDFSGNSIAYAAEQAQKDNLDIDYVRANYLHYTTDKHFDLITMIMCDFCALSPTQRQQLLAKFYQLLKPGGRILLDVYSLTAFAKKEEQFLYQEKQLNGFWSAEHYYGFLSSFKYLDEQVMLDKYTIIEESGSKTIYNWLQYFSEKQLCQELSSAGFELESLYDDVAGSRFTGCADEFAVVMRKPLT